MPPYLSTMKVPMSGAALSHSDEGTYMYVSAVFSVNDNILMLCAALSFNDEDTYVVCHSIS